MKKKIIIGGIVAIVVVAAVMFFMPNSNKQGTTTWVTTTVTSQSISQSITATGTVEPVTSVDVGTQVSGILTTLYVDYNSVVTKGQVIAELDKTTLTLERNSNRNDVAIAQSKLDFELANYTRIEALYKKDLIADSEYEQALYDYETAKNNLEIAKNDLAKSETNLGYATIYSPIDGVVLSRSVEEGQTVASSFSTPTLFTVAADLSDMQVVVDVDEADIGNVVEGQRASFSVDAFPLDVFEGIVTQVRQEGIEESNVITYEVVISANNPDLKLKPGMTANVEIFVLDIECEAVVPAGALTYTPPAAYLPSSPAGEGPRGEGPPSGMGGQGMGQGGPMGGGQGMGGERPSGPPSGEGMGAGSGSASERNRVWVLDGEEVTPRPVRVGVSNGIVTQVSGIEVGAEVVTGMETVSAASSSSGAATTTNPFVQQGPGRR